MMLVGHNTVRSLVLGQEKRAPTSTELQRMREHVGLALEQGACGFSSGLIYRPGRWSNTEEVTELAKMQRLMMRFTPPICAMKVTICWML